MAAARIDQVLTFGVEEEFVLVDAGTRTTVPRAAEVIDQVADRLDGRVQHEFFETQIELNSCVRTTAEALREDLVEGRQIVSEAAKRIGSRLVASGSAVLSHRPMRITDDPRYALMARRFPRVIEAIESETNGCHVHVGTLERSEALLLANFMRPWLPILQAVSANSPFAAGRDRGCASWRHFECRHWPTMGPAPVLDGFAYEALVSRLVDTGVIMDRKMVYWYARPSEHLPTLEIRVADVSADVDVTVLLAILTRALATTLLAEWRSGRAWPQWSEASLIAAHQDAACHSLMAKAPDPTTGGLKPMAESLARLVHRARPGLEAAGDLDAAFCLLAKLEQQGTGAQQQRVDYQRRGSLYDVVDGLAARTAD